MVNGHGNRLREMNWSCVYRRDLSWALAQNGFPQEGAGRLGYGVDMHCMMNHDGIQRASLVVVMTIECI